MDIDRQSRDEIHQRVLKCICKTQEGRSYRAVPTLFSVIVSTFHHLKSKLCFHRIVRGAEGVWS
jgi:hypothetical protein